MSAQRLADGVFRCGTELVNWYLVEDGGRVTVVDCGAPGYWKQLDPALRSIGRTREDVDAVILTHAHIDHVGFAQRLHEESGVPVWVHEDDAEMARTGKLQKPEGTPLPYLRYPFAYRMMGHLARNGMRIPPVPDAQTFRDGDRLDVPGSPLVVHMPGHSRGMCAFRFENVVFVGDGMSTLHALSGYRGPTLPPRAFNVDSAQALESLLRLPESGLLCFGHGEPWTDGAAAAVEQARARGIT